jgi:hypothetical protein
MATSLMDDRYLVELLREITKTYFKIAIHKRFCGRKPFSQEIRSHFVFFKDRVREDLILYDPRLSEDNFFNDIYFVLFSALFFQLLLEMLKHEQGRNYNHNILNYFFGNFMKKEEIGF